MPLIKITSIPQLYRNLNRSLEVFSILSKYGLADWVSRINLEFPKKFFKDSTGERIAQQPRPARIRLALTELGPTFIKLGQVLSTRRDLVGEELATELEKLQCSAPADAPAVVRRTIQEELGQSVDELFAEFDEEPLASASIAQVNRARLRTGERVAIKVQHAGIAEKFRVDLDIMVGFAQLLAKLPELVNYRPLETAAEFRRTLLRELDFGREERNIELFSAALAENPNVKIPRVYSEWSTPRVLTMELLEGTKLSDTAGLMASRIDLEEVARRGAELYLEMIFTHGCYHADPHPGNILLLEGNVIGLLDFGMVGQIDEHLREEIEEMLMAIAQRDPIQLTSVITRMGQTPPGLDRQALSIDVSDFVQHYTQQKLKSFDLAGALNDLTSMIRRYGIVLPPRVAMLIKVLVMLEGTSRMLNPTFSLIEVMQPFQKRLFWQRLSPARHMRKMRRLLSEVEHLVEALPGSLLEILQQIQSGKFDVHLDHRGLEPSVNRLVLGMLTSSLFLGSALIWGLRVPPLFFGVPILGPAGCTVSIALGFRLLRAINKSGHLD